MKKSEDSIKECFERIINEFKPFDNNDLRKYNHSLEVYNLAIELSKKKKMSQDETKLLRIIAIFHDIGRFKENKLYKEINDNSRFDHGEESASVISNNKSFLKLLKAENLEQYIDIIKKSIYYHNKLSIDELVNTKLINILMDADKISIIHSVSIEEIMPLSFYGYPSKKCLDSFRNHQLVSNGEINNNFDRLLKYLAFIFNFNSADSLQFLIIKGYISEIFKKAIFTEEDIKNEIKKIINNYICEGVA